jgi:uncharacterized repeat protein (TIGR04138 family)
LSRAKRLDLERVARELNYPEDAVFFVLSALSAVTKRPPDAGHEGGLGDGRGSPGHVTALELCQFIPRHAEEMFGGSARASKVLTAWGLCTGEDVGAVVWACVEAGLCNQGPGDRLDDFQGIDLPLAPFGEGPGSSCRPAGCRPHLPGRGRQHRPASKNAWTHRIWLFCFRRLYPVCLGTATLAVFVFWSERLTPEERPLVGRWYELGEKDGERLMLFEFRSDRSCRLQVLRRGEAAARADRNGPGRWAAREGRIVITPPAQGYLDRLARASGRVAVPVVLELAFRTPDADTLDTTRDGARRVVFHRVPAGLASYADLFPPRPADLGTPRQ